MGSTTITNSTVNSNTLPNTAGGDSVTLINSSANGLYQSGAGADSVNLSSKSSIGGYYSGVDNDTLTGTNSSVGAHVSLDAGNDQLSFDSVTMSGNNRYVYAGTGDDQLSMNAVSRLSHVNLDTGNDRLTLSNSEMFTGIGINAGTGSDSVVLQNATLPSGHTLGLGNSTANDADTLVLTDSSLVSGGVTSSGNGTFSVTVQDSTIGGVSNTALSNGAMSLGNSGGGSVLVTGTSSITGELETGTGNDTININNGANVSGFTYAGAGDDHISVSAGATAGNIYPDAGSDSVHISGATVTGQILDTVTSTTAGSDTIRIEDSTFTSAGATNVVQLAGPDNHVTVSNTEMNDNRFLLHSGNSTISIENSNLGGIGNQSAHEVSLAITDSTVAKGINLLSSAGKNQTIDIRNSSIGLGPPDGNSGSNYGLGLSSGNDQVSVIEGSTLAVNLTNLSSGDDTLVLGTDTSLVAPQSSDNIQAGYNSPGAGADLLRMYGTGDFSISIAAGYGSATLNGNPNTTTTLITNENIADITSFPDDITGTLELESTVPMTRNTVQITGFDSVEAVRCFVNGTLITTARGDVPVEQLRAGDLVQTADADLQQIRWAGISEISVLDQLLHPELIPIRIKQGVLGNGLPLRDLLVSPQHRMLVSGKIVERMFGVEQALVAAKHLLAVDGIELATGMDGFAYAHLLFDTHQVVYAEGTPSESMFAGEMALQTLDDDARKELELIFPELGLPVSDVVMLPARYFVNGRHGRKLAERAVKNGASLLNNTDVTERLLVNG